MSDHRRDPNDDSTNLMDDQTPIDQQEEARYLLTPENQDRPNTMIKTIQSTMS